MHCHWRDCQQWREEGLTLSTTSNDASKMFDASLAQYIGWREDSSVGGLAGTMKNMLEADPNFVMGHVFKNGLFLLGTGKSVRLDKEFAGDVNMMASLAEKSALPREQEHGRALKLWSQGLTEQACEVWEGILLDNPRDVLALKFAYHSYFFTGQSNQFRDVVGRVLPMWTPSIPLYGYVLGMHAFAMEENNLYDRAESTAKKALEINPKDPWSTHALCHVLEMQGRHEEGIQFMSDTVNEWSTGGLIACHNFWHWAIYYIEKGDYQSALDLFDSEVSIRSSKSKAPWELADACSLLFRLGVEGVDVGDRWNDVYAACESHLDDHILAFHDVHIILSCLGAKKPQAVTHLMDSINDYISNQNCINQNITREVGEIICRAFIAYDEGNYAEAVELFKPVRYKAYKIGGSHAQRDILNIFLIQAALKSPSKEHHKLARSLLMERRLMKDDSPLTERLMAKMLSVHAD